MRLVQRFICCYCFPIAKRGQREIAIQCRGLYHSSLINAVISLQCFSDPGTETIYVTADERNVYADVVVTYWSEHLPK